jgi:hypothetical protein
LRLRTSSSPQPAPSANVPPDAQLGDEVRVGAETLRVGYDRALTNSPVADANGEVIRPARRWQRELGAGLDGPWQQTPLTVIGEPRPILEKSDVPLEKDSQNGNGVTVQTERLPREMEELDDGSIKIGTGILEKIGLPDYSSLQFLGPITISRAIKDDGRRTHGHLRRRARGRGHHCGGGGLRAARQYGRVRRQALPGAAVLVPGRQRRGQAASRLTSVHG